MAEDTEKTAQEYWDASGDEESGEKDQEPSEDPEAIQTETPEPEEEVTEEVVEEESAEEPEEEVVDWQQLAADREEELKTLSGVQKSYNDMRPEFDRRLSENQKLKERNYELEQQSIKRELAEIKSGKDVQPDQNEKRPNGLSFTDEENEFLEDAPEFRSIVEKMMTPIQLEIAERKERESQLLQQIDVLAGDHEERRQVALRETGHNVMASRGLAEDVTYGSSDTVIPLYLTIAEDQGFKNWVNSDKPRGDYLAEQVRLGNMSPVADAIELFMARNPGYTPDGVTSEIGYGREETPDTPEPAVSPKQAQRRKILEGVDTGQSPVATKKQSQRKLDPETSTEQDYWKAAGDRV